MLCLFLGKTQIANKTSKGFKKTGFDGATKSAAKGQSAARGKSQDVSQLINKLKGRKSKGIFDIELNPKEVKAVKQFYFDSQISADVAATNVDNLIASLEQARQHYLNESQYFSQLLGLIKKCKKKTLPEVNTVEVIYTYILSEPYRVKGDHSGEGHVAVMAKIPYAVVFAGELGYSCFKLPPVRGNGAIYKAPSSNPCFHELLSDYPDACDHLMEKDKDGKPLFYYAVLSSLNFYFKDREGGVPFDTAARAAEARIRAGTNFGGWLDSTQYTQVKNVDLCQGSLFQ